MFNSILLDEINREAQKCLNKEQANCEITKLKLSTK